MGHEILAIVAKGPFDQEVVKRYELSTREIGEGLSLAFIDHYFSAYWQAKLGETGHMPHEDPGVGCLPPIPDEAVMFRIVRELLGTDPHWAMIATYYIAGMGSQWACVYRGTELEPGIRWINDALRTFGVVAKEGLDEFDTVGLDQVRRFPDDMADFSERCDELGV